MKIRITIAIDRKATTLIAFSANQSENLNFFLLKVIVPSTGFVSYPSS